MRIIRLRASSKHGGSGGLESFNFWLLIRRGGVPSGVEGFIINLISELIPLFQEIMMFEGKQALSKSSQFFSALFLGYCT